jgi:hypothetical protein
VRDLAKRRIAIGDATYTVPVAVGDMLACKDDEVARLITELAELRDLYADRDRDLAHEYARANAAEAALEAQSEDVQTHWLSPVEAAGLRGEVARLRKLVDAPAEYDGRDADGVACCSSCGGDWLRGHKPDCERQLALGLAPDSAAPLVMELPF